MSYGQVRSSPIEYERRQTEAFVAAVAERHRTYMEREEAERAAARASMSPFRRAWTLVKAYLRISPEAVCLMTTPTREFHDYPDGHLGTPDHFVTHYCKRCSRGFTI
jgi:hypothetical protein